VTGPLSGTRGRALILALPLVVAGSFVQACQPGPAPGPNGSVSPVARGSPVPGTSPVAVSCPAATVTVRDAASLKQALARAGPGDSIRMLDGAYDDRFVAATSGTAAKPIFLCGGPAAVIDGGGTRNGYGFHVDGASYWRLVGFTVRDIQKGVVVDKSQHVLIHGLTVQNIGEEGIHLRDFSSDNVVEGNTVQDTGLRKPGYGEGIYIGSAQSNWCTVTACQPDRSDRNVVRGNTILRTAAECVDIKEGTTGGVVSGNTFDGSALSRKNSANSWVDVKGNNWLIEGNVGHNSVVDGFETHEVVSGWGRGNVFKANTADVDGSGYAFNLTPANDNKVSCDNKVAGAAKGLANVPCH
jgi:parallel beta-helix repeat protein